MTATTVNGSGTTTGHVGQLLGQAQQAQQGQGQDQYVLVPAGFWGSLIKSIAPTAGGIIGSVFGNQQAGQSIGQTVGQVAGVLPFSTVPASALQGLQGGQQVSPMSAGPAGAAQPQQAQGQQGQDQDQYVLVPAGFWGSLIKTIAPTAGGIIGSVFGNQQAGQSIGQTVGQVAGVLPFSTVPASALQGLQHQGYASASMG
jgi:hypothetical protein